MLMMLQVEVVVEMKEHPMGLMEHQMDQPRVEQALEHRPMD